MKKIILFMLSIFFMLGIASCGNEKETLMSISLEGEEKTDDYEYDFECSYDEKMLLGFDNKTYHKELSILLSLLSSDVYSDAVTTIKSHPDENIYDVLGYEHKRVVMDPTVYDTDSHDVSNYILAKKKIDYEGNTHTILLVVIAGSDESTDAWKSNLDIGCDSECYYSITGSHPLWDDTSYHKGFYVTSKRIEEDIRSYIGEDTENLTLILTGHSRGAAISNILGYRFEKETEYKTATYTFACPYVTEDDGECSTIFNIINEDDLIPKMPLESYEMKRFGRDVLLDMKEYKDEYKEAFRMTYHECNPKSIAEYVKGIAPTRESLYTFIEGDSGESYYDYYLIEKNEASGMEALKEKLSEDGLLCYAEVYIKKGTIDYLCIRFTPAFLLNFAINTAFADSPVSYFTDRLTYLNTDYYGVVKDLYENISTDGIWDAHMASTYYFMTCII